MSKTVYQVHYDIRIGRQWLGAGNKNGFASMNVATRGDARDAAARVVKEEYRTERGGKTANAVRIISVVAIVEDVIA